MFSLCLSHGGCSCCVEGVASALRWLKSTILVHKKTRSFTFPPVRICIPVACQCLWLLSRHVYRVTVLIPFWKSLKWLQALCFLLLWGSLSHLSLTNGFGGTCCAMKKIYIMNNMPEISRHKHSAGFQTRLTTDCVNYVLWNIGKAAVWRLSHMQFITITWANVREMLELIVLDKDVNEIIVP